MGSKHSFGNSANRLLERLPNKEFDRLMGVAQPASLARGDEIYRQEAPLRHVYFPKTGVCSIAVVMSDGRHVEATTVGNEGMIGLPAYLGIDFAPNSAVAQVAIDGWRVPVSAFRDKVIGSNAFDRIVRHYIAYSIHYAKQMLACNALHSVPERASRCLLMVHDRVGEDEFELTHELLAKMLGVHRQTVTAAAGALQQVGLISYRRGLIRVQKRKQLEETACECYQATKNMYERIMRAID